VIECHDANGIMDTLGTNQVQHEKSLA